MTRMVRHIPTLTAPIDTVVRPPGSKSETIRALAAASLAPGRSLLHEPLIAEDTAAMIGALRAMGIGIDDDVTPWAIEGRGGHLAAPQDPIDANESGLSARILLAMAAGLAGATRIVGRGRLPERPMAGIVEVLRRQGVEVRGDQLPIEVVGSGPLSGGRIEVDCSESSQFATALMLVAPLMEGPAMIEPRGLAGSEGYIEGTVSIMRRFGARVEHTDTGYSVGNEGYEPSEVFVEPDASAAVYPMAIAAITGGQVTIDRLGKGTWQPDLGVASVLGSMGCVIDWHADRVTVDARDVRLAGVDVDMSHAPDGALALAVVCLFATEPSRIGGLGSLRHKESDRLVAISNEIRRVGGGVNIEDDALVIHPSDLHGGEIDPHGDHRIAMAMATAGTRIEGMSVTDPHVVNKTWPGFWGLLDRLGAA